MIVGAHVVVPHEQVVGEGLVTRVQGIPYPEFA